MDGGGGEEIKFLAIEVGDDLGIFDKLTQL